MEPSPSRRASSPAADLGTQGSKTEPSVPRSVTLLGDRRVRLASGASIDDRIRAIADGQRARMTRAQLLAAGVSRCAIQRRVHNGRLELLHRAVYGLPHTSDLPLAAEAAALLACGAGAVLSHHSAATLLRLRPGAARPVHVTIPGHRGAPSPTGVVVHRA
jgi:hypothetical protein